MVDALLDFSSAESPVLVDAGQRTAAKQDQMKTFGDDGQYSGKSGHGGRVDLKPERRRCRAAWLLRALKLLRLEQEFVADNV